jgi:hypothetical protein
VIGPASIIDVAGSSFGTAPYARQILQEMDRDEQAALREQDRAEQAALREQDRRENDRRHRQTMLVAWAAAGISIVSAIIAIISAVIAYPA